MINIKETNTYKAVMHNRDTKISGGAIVASVVFQAYIINKMIRTAK